MTKPKGMLIATAAALMFANAVDAANVTPLKHRCVSVSQVGYVTNSCNHYDPPPQPQPYHTYMQNNPVDIDHPYPYSDLRDDTINNHFGDPENYPYHVQ